MKREGILDTSRNILVFLIVDLGMLILLYLWVKQIYIMNPKDTLFFAEMYSLVKKMEETIEEFEMQDRTLASIVVGVIDLDAIESGGESAEMKTMYSFNLDSRHELETVKDVMDKAYSPDDGSLDDLLGDLGISLN